MMRRGPLGVGMALAALASAGLMAGAAGQPIVMEDEKATPPKAPKESDEYWNVRGPKVRMIRSRGPSAKPKKHRNMLHVKKRVRRKHRRAA